MDIKSNSLYSQMQNMSLQAMGNKPPAIDVDVINGTASNSVGKINESTSNFGDMLTDALKSVNDLQTESGEKKRAFEMGDSNVTLAEVMIASSKSGIALDATVQIRNKFVEAYKEIMSMPV
ncbi:MULTISPECIES: flagellar hook-basal body complex protein FliE [Colwellia]|uniref:Flagellar hook-basal body complex protein FliE n=2 Tax=Colwellia TaxID=28228 RepID=A0A5C6QKQ0_9GAMM|nr:MULTISPECIES: flagellar hook-basal body complex protein FliE [Colwellia]AAZ25645.1 flagellar hook-basal body complex protein FliE [Colwellia psychrerythraea 34H]PKH88731.1 flagellar hook-basal body complex protein FliE [Colwellia sp. Bg11-28]TWX69535.1 flagellar hook-basal body complex protein FliE [Colwellia demingiae]